MALRWKLRDWEKAVSDNEIVRAEFPKGFPCRAVDVVWEAFPRLPAETPRLDDLIACRDEVLKFAMLEALKKALLKAADVRPGKKSDERNLVNSARAATGKPGLFPLKNKRATRAYAPHAWLFREGMLKVARDGEPTGEDLLSLLLHVFSVADAH
jgi:hypothetical protein